jgi:hypothetical protein
MVAVRARKRGVKISGYSISAQMYVIQIDIFLDCDVGNNCFEYCRYLIRRSQDRKHVSVDLTDPRTHLTGVE